MAKIISFVRREYKYWLLPLLVIVLIVLANPIPSGKVVALGDFYQVIGAKSNLSNYLFTWFKGVGQGMYNPLITTFPLYLMQAIFEMVRVPLHLITSLWIGSFLIFSWVSFAAALMILEPYIRKSELAWDRFSVYFLALLYPVNVYVFGLFQYGWGYDHHVSFYIFIPILIASFFDYSMNPSWFKLWRHALIFLIATICFNNLAFWAATFLAQGLIWCFLTLSRPLKEVGGRVLSLMWIWFTQTVLSLYFLIPQIIAQHSDISRFVDSSMYLLMKNDPTPLNDLLRLVNLKGFFPRYDLYHHWIINYLTDYFYYLPWLIVLSWCFWWLYVSNTRDIKTRRSSVSAGFYCFLLGLFSFTVLVVRSGEPFTRINSFIYHLPGFSLFRSADKLHSIYIFFLYLVIAFILLLIQKKWWRWTLTAILLLLPLPLYFHGITKYLTTEHNSKTWDLEPGGYSTVVKPPDEYFSIQSTINADKTQTSVVSLPYSVTNSFNWSNYPKWHFLGHDFLYLLYGRPYVSANVFADPSRDPTFIFKDINDQHRSTTDLMTALQNVEGRFVIWHKDIEPIWTTQSQYLHGLLNDLANQKEINLLTSNDYFELYEIAEKNRVPLITANVPVTWEKINPTQYRLTLYGIKDQAEIVFRQSYNTGWKIYSSSYQESSQPCPQSVQYISSPVRECLRQERYFRPYDLRFLFGPSLNLSHTMALNYANDWKISSDQIRKIPKSSTQENSDGTVNLSLIINFYPQVYYYLGLIASFLFLTFIYIKTRKDKTKINHGRE